MNRFSQRHQDLTFGDFDRDGRTDVRIVQNGKTLTSWGGSSAWDDGSPDPVTPPAGPSPPRQVVPPRSADAP